MNRRRVLIGTGAAVVAGLGVGGYLLSTDDRPLALVYRGPAASLQGQYIFGDFVQPRIWSLTAASLSRGLTQPSSAFTDRKAGFMPDRGAFTSIVAFGADRSGNLYIVDFDGEIFMLEPLATL